jgi:hypothetical protein
VIDDDISKLIKNTRAVLDIKKTENACKQGLPARFSGVRTESDARVMV